jgi:putative intracellular protease/amidase
VAAGRPAGNPSPLEERAERVRRYDAVLDEVVARRLGRVHVVSIDDLVCPGGSCPAVVDGLLVRHGTQGFAPAFARRVAPELAARIRAALTPPRRAG